MKSGLGFAAALLVSVALLVVLAAGMIGSEAARAAIERAGTEALGRRVQCKELRFGLLPPSLIVVRPKVAGENEHQPPFVVADEVALRVALLPLLTGAILFDVAVVDGAVLNITRTHDGVTLPGAGLPASPTSDSGNSSGAADRAPGLKLAVLALEIREGTIIFSDGTLAPAFEWRFQGVRGRVELKPTDESLGFELAMEVASGGSIEARGKATFDGEFDAVATIDGLVLDPATRYIDVGTDPALAELTRPPLLTGFASGSLALKGPIGSPDLQIDLMLRDGRLDLNEIELSGPLQIAASMSGPLGRHEGSFEIDATDAEMRYSGAFAKPVGTRASVSGRIVSRGGTHTVDDVRLKIANLDAHGSIHFGERTKVTFDTAPFELEGWEEFVSALEELQPSGQVRIEAVEVSTAPLDLRGVVGLEGISISPFSGPPLLVHGELIAEGDVLRSRSLSVEVAGQKLDLDASVAGLGSKPRHRLRVRADGIDANALLNAYVSPKDTIYGSLDLRADVSETPLEGVPMLRTLEGNLSFEIKDGRLVGVSLLESALESILPVLGFLRLALSSVGGRASEELRSDKFDSLSLSLNIAEGVLSTEHLRLVYPGYAVDLWGTLHLEGLEIDMKGQLSMGGELASLLTGMLGERHGGAGHVIPLASVRGTLFEPKVVVTPDAMRNLVAHLGLPVAGEKLQEALEKVGEKEAKVARTILEDLFGSRKSRAD